MVYCDHCMKTVVGELLKGDGYICCDVCGKILEAYYFYHEPTFVNNCVWKFEKDSNDASESQSIASVVNAAKTHDESETFSDIDDEEVDDYLYNEEEKVIRKFGWESANREFLEKQAEAAAVEAVETGVADLQI